MNLVRVLGNDLNEKIIGDFNEKVMGRDLTER